MYIWQVSITTKGGKVEIIPSLELSYAMNKNSTFKI